MKKKKYIDYYYGTIPYENYLAISAYSALLNKIYHNKEFRKLGEPKTISEEIHKKARKLLRFLGQREHVFRNHLILLGQNLNHDKYTKDDEIRCADGHNLEFNYQFIKGGFYACSGDNPNLKEELKELLTPLGLYEDRGGEGRDHYNYPDSFLSDVIFKTNDWRYQGDSLSKEGGIYYLTDEEVKRSKEKWDKRYDDSDFELSEEVLRRCSIWEEFHPYTMKCFKEALQKEIYDPQIYENEVTKGFNNRFGDGEEGLTTIHNNFRWNYYFEKSKKDGTFENYADEIAECLYTYCEEVERKEEKREEEWEDHKTYLRGNFFVNMCEDCTRYKISGYQSMEYDDKKRAVLKLREVQGNFCPECNGSKLIKSYQVECEQIPEYYQGTRCIFSDLGYHLVIYSEQESRERMEEWDNIHLPYTLKKNFI